MNKISFFKARHDQFKEQHVSLYQKTTTISILRIIVFIAYIIIFVYAANQSNLTAVLGATAVFIILFGILVNYHNKTRFESNHQKYQSQINLDEISRLKIELDKFDPGWEFLTPEHPYTADLDIFGKNSIFQLINRSTTFYGRKTISDWLSKKSNKPEILERQNAVNELSENIDWIQDYQASGMHYEQRTDISIFMKWLKSGSLISNHLLYKIYRFGAPLLLITCIAGIFLFNISVNWLILIFVLNTLVLIRVQGKIKDIHNNTSLAIKSLQGLEIIIRKIEVSSFQSEKLNIIQNAFSEGQTKASDRINKLKLILQNLDNRGNMIYQIINAFLMLDLHFSIAAEKWKSNHPENIPLWFDTLGHMEALVCLAGFKFANPEYIFPTIKEGSHHFKTEQLAHPLIPYNGRVANNFSLSGKGDIGLITGSNMAGKSTFLRTAGVNYVLGLAGGPVCARSCEISEAQVFTSMRTQDNLEENISSFYAELKRIEQLLTLSDMEFPIFFLLDEILKGTNSHDRHLGAVSLVHQLADKNTSGLISTHDIDLAKETSQGRKVANFSFNSRIVNNEIFFDYLLKPGICKSFNASKLMEKMGIKLLKLE